jgi:hypothetical protein
VKIKSITDRVWVVIAGLGVSVLCSIAGQFKEQPAPSPMTAWAWREITVAVIAQRHELNIGNVLRHF